MYTRMNKVTRVSAAKRRIRTSAILSLRKRRLATALLCRFFALINLENTCTVYHPRGDEGGAMRGQWRAVEGDKSPKKMSCVFITTVAAAIGRICVQWAWLPPITAPASCRGNHAPLLHSSFCHVWLRSFCFFPVCFSFSFLLISFNADGGRRIWRLELRFCRFRRRRETRK